MAQPQSQVLQSDTDGVRLIAFRLDDKGKAGNEQARDFLAHHFLDSTADANRVVVDLSGVASLDSSCLGPMVQKLRQVQQTGGRLVLTGVGAPALEEIFSLTRFDKVFTITKTREEALAAAHA